MPRALTKPTSVCAPALGPVPAPSSLARPLLCFPATKKSAVRSPRPSAQTSPPGSRPQTGPSAAAGLMNPPAGMLRARTVSVAEKPRDAGRSGTGSGTSPEWISGSWPRLGYAVSGSGGNLERAAARPPVPSPRQQPARPGPRGATPSAASTQGPPGGRQAEARLAAKRAARAEAREIRMKELERQQKEIYQVQKEDSERYSRRSRRLASASDEDERLSVGSRGSLRSQPDPESGGPYAWSNGYDGELSGPQPVSRRSGRNSSYSGDGRFSTLSSPREEKLPSYLCGAARPAGSYRASVFQESSIDLARRGSACSSLAPAEYSGHLNSSSRASSRASSARASPVVEERPEKDFSEKGSRNMPSLSAATLASLGGTSSRRGSGDTSISIDTEASMREIKELNELKDQIQDVEGKYMQGLKEMKDSLAEVEEKYKKAMVSNAQLDNEKTNFMYQVDTLKDVLLELEEELAEARRQCEDKSKELERERHAHSVLQFQLAEVKEALRQRDEMLEEIRQLQQKQASYIREISDLQETIEWKDKKIGALERQKEFFDSIRSERDDLREEIVKLKEESKKHGIILNSEVATNGETSDTLNNVGHPGSTKMTTEEINALKSSGDGTLGRAKEVKVENEIVENVGKRAILQNTEREQHKEDTVRDGVGIQVSHPGESAEGQTAFEDFTNAECKEQVQSRGPENCETPGQVGSQEATVMPVEGTEASLGQPKCPEDLGSGAPGPGHSQDACHALGGTEQSEKPVERQDQENQGLKTDVEEFHPKLCGGSAPVQGAQVERMSCADPGGPGGDHTEEELEAGGGAAGAPESHPGNPPVGELDSGTGHSSEKALTEQEAAEPGEAPAQSAEVGREDSVEDEGDVEKKDEKLVQTEAQTVPGAPTAQNGQEEAPGPGRADTDREPNEGKSNHQAEASDSSQKKSKSKKKKNKKKKSPAPIESLEDVKKELTYQNAEEGEAQEECRQFASKKPAAEAQEEGTDNALQSVVPGSGEGDDRPEAEVDGKLNQEDEDVEAEGEGGAAAGDAVDFAGSSAPSLGTNAGEKEGVEVVTNSSSTETAGVPPEVEDAEGTGSSLQHNAGPSGAIADACETGSPESCVTSQQQRQPVLEAAGSGSLEKGDLSEPTGEPGDLSAESGGREKGGSERGKGKEDCTMS
ncbi:PREDICTED: leucine-rich repeat flightless-interacting protein 1 isoform X5 [Chinchilla lanigera]|uniref:leucine-rich repeat flightless-interacting protein 1 isoform X5 n=1 Tax=Chinchilla lanigera TaxID=34839 RepID=UPI0006964D34|nr:PREDICTED: leucine-rich repeat flightless-interacting protein 1 isoform X5 [Chinchilla lanigera]